MEFDTASELVAHVNDHMGSGKASYICQWRNCTRLQKPFTKRHKVQNHVRIHTKERPYICTMEDCGKTFSRLDGLNTHIRTHSSVKPYICETPGCGKAYFHSRSLRKHERIHMELDETPLTDAVSQKQHMTQNDPYQHMHHAQYPFVATMNMSHSGTTSPKSMAHISHPTKPTGTLNTNGSMQYQQGQSMLPNYSVEGVSSGANSTLSSINANASGNMSDISRQYQIQHDPMQSKQFDLMSQQSGSTISLPDYTQGMYQAIQSQPYRQSYQQHQQMLLQHQQLQQLQQLQQQSFNSQSFPQLSMQNPSEAYKIDLISQGSVSGVEQTKDYASNGSALLYTPWVVTPSTDL
ncbi:hypothetical protein BATDEDRAFT_36629 [Batrachochytrium dendrobatidis JAM81]|uniref:C2H2-type domain-containing protein n=2 Tax=Batrachochytrium dendrobatidis TaxID=109871 RepID=F4NW86_BATDJ|nr:uncharacterized protein BATDEDRAFT_36629 [Batrachochytrium dendrobatidis JAM81]EGF82786.1 hypothetical protein BATDEDRAFT_36629 [Batrachochytrium dendrobatidis JAM81]|eukprot:XP_006676851.1 hypothetical protein BATDEDRAFT_36629 [Batrachochytrium dendrobatidis JAM81]